MDKFDWDALTEAVIGLIDRWENKRKNNKKMKMVVELEYSQIRINFLNCENNKMLQSFPVSRNESEDRGIFIYNRAYNFIKNAHKMEVQENEYYSG